MSGLSGLSDKGLSVQCACGNTATVTSSQHSSSQPPLCCWGDVTVWRTGWPTSPHRILWRNLTGDDNIKPFLNLKSRYLLNGWLDVNNDYIIVKDLSFAETQHYWITHNFVLKGKHFVWRIFTRSSWPGCGRSWVITHWMIQSSSLCQNSWTRSERSSWCHRETRWNGQSWG